jgi:hypothetical protein
MHPVFCLPEVVSLVVGELSMDDPEDVADLLSLATTSRVFSEAAFDVIWDEVSIWNLAQRMDASLWTIAKIGEHQDYELVGTGQCHPAMYMLKRIWQDLVGPFSAKLEHLGDRFLRYARRVRKLTINGKERGDPDLFWDRERLVQHQLSPRVISLWTQCGALAVLPQLRELDVTSPPFGDPWDLHIILDLVNGRPDFANLWVDQNSWVPSRWCGQTFRVSTPLSGQLHVGPGPGVASDALLHAFLACSPPLTYIFVRGEFVTVAEIVQMARLPRLELLHIWSRCLPAPVPCLAHDAFRHLKILRLREDGAGADPMLFRLFLAMPPNSVLSDLSYTYHARYSGFPLLADVRRFVQRASLWTAVTELEFGTEYTMEKYDLTVDESRGFFQELHALSALTQLTLSCNIYFPLPLDVIRDVLYDCPHLVYWWMRFGDHEPRASASVSFQQLRALVGDRHIQMLPVRLRCDTLPDPGDAQGWEPLFLHSLHIHNIRDPVAAGTLFASLFPNLGSVYTIIVERSDDDNDDDVYAEDGAKLDAVYAALLAARAKSEPVAWDSELEDDGGTA